MGRKRGHINLTEKLAAALSLLLPSAQRDDLRRRTPPAPASEVVSLFQFDHAVLHCHDGSDEWHNLTPMLIAAHREKSRRDNTVVAKVRHLDEKWSSFTAAMAKGRKPKRQPSRWPKQKFPRRR